MTTNHDRAATTVDFLFFNESSDFQLVATAEVPRIGASPKIPDGHHGSDHYSVAATFELHADIKSYQF